LTKASVNVDPARCPLCGGENACAMACDEPQAQRGACWCTAMRFSPDLLARVPPELRHKACICATCAQAADQAGRGG
jgi:hypothetical protein